MKCSIVKKYIIECDDDEFDTIILALEHQDYASAERIKVALQNLKAGYES